jgi:hypothetical protein
MDLVLGIFCNYGSNLKIPKGGLYYFLKSLRKVNNTCKVKILCRQIDIVPNVSSFCESMNVELIPSIPNHLQNPHEFQIYRYFHIYNMLNNENIKYNKILISDLVDVIFQEDPFHFKIENGLYAAAEQNILSDTSNGSSLINMRWINQYKNLKDLNFENFNNKYVICCGTIIGYHDNILDYLKFYNSINLNFNNDQAVINIYIYNFNKHLNPVDYDKSKILTLDKIKFENLKCNEKGFIVNKNNELYSIIHQIDRCNLPYMLNLVENM